MRFQWQHGIQRLIHVFKADSNNGGSSVQTISHFLTFCSERFHMGHGSSENELMIKVHVQICQ